MQVSDVRDFVVAKFQLKSTTSVLLVIILWLTRIWIRLVRRGWAVRRNISFGGCASNAYLVWPAPGRLRVIRLVGKRSNDRT